MPPKKTSKPGAKVEQKKKDKVIEDRTFGLKNKKGTKQQIFIKQVQQQVKYGNPKTSKNEKENEKVLGKKELKKKEQEELNMLFRPSQKVGKGADPKSVVCAFFKQGSCGKGAKCKFSHDLTLERKAEKRNMYDDGKDPEEDKEKDTMDGWDDEKLAEVVAKKHLEADKLKNAKTSTDIVCKHFINAIEEFKYGWFWSCPGGGNKCMYKHALPPGFVLKRDKKKAAEQAAEQDQISLEELVEDERTKLSSKNLTKITLETFNSWKAKKIKEKKKKQQEEMRKKKDDVKLGKSLGVTGRELFSFRPELVDGDDMEADEGEMTYVHVREMDDTHEYKGMVDLTFEGLAAAAREADNSGTISMDGIRAGTTSQRVPAGQRSTTNPAGGPTNGESGKLEEAAAIAPSTDNAGQDDAAAGALVNGVEVNEDLFGGGEDVEVDENLFDAELEGLDEDLDNIDLE